MLHRSQSLIPEHSWSQHSKETSIQLEFPSSFQTLKVYLFFFVKLRGHENVSFHDCVAIQIDTPFAPQSGPQHIVYQGNFSVHVDKNDLQFFKLVAFN